MVETYQPSQSQFFVRTLYDDASGEVTHDPYHCRDHAAMIITSSQHKGVLISDSGSMTPELRRQPQKQLKINLSAVITEDCSRPTSGNGFSGNGRGIPFIRKVPKYYRINVTHDFASNPYFVQRRFNEFHSLAQQLRQDFPHATLPMPEKKRLQTALDTVRPATESEMMKQRKKRLDEFVQFITEDLDLMAHPLVIAFFGLDRELGKQKLSNESFSSDDVSGNARSCGAAGDGGGDNSFTSSSLRSPSPTVSLSTDEKLSLGPTEQQQMRPDDFQFLKTIGRGNFGRVFQAILTRTNDVYAVKVLDKTRVALTERDRNHVMTERNVLVINLNHPFLVCLRFSFQTKTKLYFVMDYINGGELFFHLQKSGFFSEELSCFYSAEIASALGYLHSRDIIYRDLKPENLLIDAEGHIKLTDFGLCKKFFSEKTKSSSSSSSSSSAAANGGDQQHPRTRTYCGTPEYLAPEMIRHESYGFEVDWWCLGAVTYEMVFSLPPWYSKDHQRMHIDVLNQPLELERRDRRVSGNCKKFLRELLTRSPNERLGHRSDFAEIKQHAFFANINWTELDARRIKPPFVPRVVSKRDLANIDPGFQSEAVTESVIYTTTTSNGKQRDSGYGDGSGRNYNNNVKQSARCPVPTAVNRQHYGGGFSVSVRETDDDNFEGFSYVAPFPGIDAEQHDQD